MSQRRRGSFSTLHPIWRGIGFLLLIIVPVIAYGLVEMGIQYMFESDQNFANTFSATNPDGIDLIYLQVGATLLVSFILYLVLSILGSLLYSLLGGSEDAEVASRIGSERRR